MIIFKANWTGGCPGCKKKIKRGQPVTWFKSGLFEKVACHMPCIEILKRRVEQRELTLDFAKFLMQE